MKKDTAILMIHGFGGEFSEISPLYDLLTQKDYTVKAPTLAGHGGSKKDLSQTSFTDWITSTIETFSALKVEYGKVAVIGFSMGGLVATNLYALTPFASLITINTPIYFWNIREMLKNLRVDFASCAQRYIYEARNKPVNSLFEFMKILNRSKELFHDVSCDTLILQSLDDDIVKPKSADYIYDSVAGYKKKCFYDAGSHQILKTDKVYEISEEIDIFLRRNRV